jgi:hypothetical protein
MLNIEEFYNDKWFLERPQRVQEAFKVFDVSKEHYLKISDSVCYGVYIIGVDELDDDSVTYRIYTSGMFGFLPRQVFGITRDDIFTFEQIAHMEILYHTEDPYE